MQTMPLRLREFVRLHGGRVLSAAVVVLSVAAVGAWNTGEELGEMSAGGTSPSLIIDWGATGTEKVLDAPNFWIKANGDASFGGTVTSTEFTAATANFNGVRVGGAGGGGDYADLTAVLGTLYIANSSGYGNVDLGSSGGLSCGGVTCTTITLNGDAVSVTPITVGGTSYNVLTVP